MQRPAPGYLPGTSTPRRPRLGADRLTRWRRQQFGTAAPMLAGVPPGEPRGGGGGGSSRVPGAPHSPLHNFEQRAPPSLPSPFLTQILPQVEQKARGSPAELIEEGAQAEDQQGGHAETVVPEGEAQERQQGDAALPAAQAGRGAPQRGPMGPGIRAAAGMLLLLLLLLHRLLRCLAQPARARKRSPIRLRGGEPGRPAAHGQGRAEGSPGGGGEGPKLPGSGDFPRHGPRRRGPSGRGAQPRLGGTARARPAPASAPVPRAPPRLGLARGRRGSPPAPAWTPRLCVCRSRRVLSGFRLL